MKKLLCLLLLNTHITASMNWSDPVILSDPSQNATSPKIALSYSTGRAAAIWKISDGSYETIQACLFNGTTWSIPVNLSNSLFNSDEASIGINNSGHALAIWRRHLSSTTSSIEATFFNGTSWSIPVILSSTNTCDAPTLAIHPSADHAIALWRSSSGFGTLSSSWFNGTTWTPIDDFSPLANPAALSLSMNADDQAIASWISPGSQKTAWTSFYDAGWSVPQAISNTNPAVIQIDSAIDSSTNRAGVIWSSLSTIDAAMWSGTEWESVESLVSSATFVIEPDIFFHPTNHSSGAIWRGSLGVQGAVYSSLNWSSPLTLTDQGITPKAAFNPIDEKIGAVWTTTTALQFTEYDATSFSLPIDLATSSEITSPDIVIDYEGNSFAIWSAIVDDSRVIQVARGTSESP